MRQSSKSYFLLGNKSTRSVLPSDGSPEAKLPRGCADPIARGAERAVHPPRPRGGDRCSAWAGTQLGVASALTQISLNIKGSC